MICLDTNIIYHFLFETELTSASEKILREAIIEGMAIPMIVYNELLYTTGAKIARIKYGVKGKYSFRKHIAKQGFPEEAIEKVNDLIRDFKVTILKDYQDPDELANTIRIYRLAPNDAQIVLTCKHYSINTIATFDEDFKRVPWLRVIP
jgi:predicted nucleic acid-binding protein